jgi:hypothetical protein
MPLRCGPDLCYYTVFEVHRYAIVNYQLRTTRAQEELAQPLGENELARRSVEKKKRSQRAWSRRPLSDVAPTRAPGSGMWLPPGLSRGAKALSAPCRSQLGEELVSARGAQSAPALRSTAPRPAQAVGPPAAQPRREKRPAWGVPEGGESQAPG